MKDKLKRYWIDGFKINISGGIIALLLITIIGLVDTIIPGEIFPVFILAFAAYVFLMIPLVGFIFKKILIKTTSLNTYSKHAKFGWECNFIIIVLGIFAYPIIAVMGLIYYFLNLFLPNTIANILFFIPLIIFIPLVAGYYFHKWVVAEKIHQGTTSKKGFLRNYWKPIILYIGVYLFLVLYEGTKNNTEWNIPNLIGRIIGLTIFIFIGFLLYNLIEKKINKPKPITLIKPFKKNKQKNISGKVMVIVIGGMILLTMGILIFISGIVSTAEIEPIPSDVDWKCVNECDKVIEATFYFVEAKSADSELFTCFCMNDEDSILLEKTYRYSVQE
jgi:hypothetical protein